jgi:hypothetical protein
VWPPELGKHFYFALAVLKGPVLKDRPCSPLLIASKTWLLPSVAGLLEQHWEKWLGSIQAEAIRNSSFHLLVAQQRSPNSYFVREHTDLLRKLIRLVMLGFLGRCPRIETGIYCTGHDEEVSSIEEAARFRFPPRVYISRVFTENLLWATRVLPAVESIVDSKDRDRFYRLRQGLYSLDRAMRARWAADRLHLFVRAADAIFNTEQGHGKEQFSRRGQLLIGESDESRRSLETLYALRNHVEHLRDPRRLLSEASSDDPEREAFRLAFQAEILSCNVWRRFLEKTDLLPRFVDDASISAFWKQPKKDLLNAFGPPTALSEEVARRFHGQQGDLHEIGGTGL